MGRLGKLKRELIQEANKQLLNENITCQCFAGNTKMTCWDYNSYGACCNHYFVHNSKCCPTSQGGTDHSPHPMCHDMHCGNLSNTTCFDNVVNPTTGDGGLWNDELETQDLSFDQGGSFPGYEKEVLNQMKTKDSDFKFIKVKDTEKIDTTQYR